MKRNVPYPNDKWQCSSCGKSFMADPDTLGFVDCPYCNPRSRRAGRKMKQ